MAAAEALVAAANARGGEDNVTVVLFEIEEGEPVFAEAETPSAGEDESHAPAVAETEPEVAMSSEVESSDATPGGVSRHGAGAGGRIAALALIAAVAVIGLLALYWGLSK
jgi:hypothetical protein